MSWIHTVHSQVRRLVAGMPCFICKLGVHNRLTCTALSDADGDILVMQAELRHRQERRDEMLMGVQIAQQKIEDLQSVLQAAQKKKDELQSNWDIVLKKSRQKSKQKSNQQVTDSDSGGEVIESADGIFWEELSFPVVK